MRIIKFQTVVEGLLTFLPGCSNILTKSTQGTDSARYCYSVWLRHDAKTHPFRKKTFDTVVELGPGDSLGIGLSALLTGSKKYIGIDAVKYAALDRNQEILRELVHLFATHARIPDSDEFPDVKPFLADYDSPSWLSGLSKLVYEERSAKILRALHNPNASDSMIAYLPPELADTRIADNSVDCIFSQAVLEHVDELDRLYHNCYKWLVPGGLMSHQIDFKSHGLSVEWNGHWTYSPLVWRMIKGRRAYLINREPCSTHLRLMRNAGFEIISIERQRRSSRLKRSHLAHEYSHLDENDLETAGVYIIAGKPTTAHTIKPKLTSYDSNR